MPSVSRGDGEKAAESDHADFLTEGFKVSTNKAVRMLGDLAQVYVGRERHSAGVDPKNLQACLCVGNADFDFAVEAEHFTLTWPGYLGGIDWGGVSVDPGRGLMIVNNNQVANYNRLITRAEADRRGIKPANAAHMTNVDALCGDQPFLSPLAIPCQQPPYGRINAVDLRTGKLVWSRRFGTSRDSGPLLLPTFIPIPMGVPNIGGSVATASGLTFIGATQEHAFRAYPTKTGRTLWKARLPAGGNASPSTYWSAASGRQFVVIPAGGHRRLLSGSSDQLVAYALPKK